MMAGELRADADEARRRAEWMRSYRRYEDRCVKAGLMPEKTERQRQARAKKFAQCEQEFKELIDSPDAPPRAAKTTQDDELLAIAILNSVPLSELPRATPTTLEDLVVWCQNARSNTVFPTQLRTVRGAAERMGIRVTLPEMPSDSDVFRARVGDGWGVQILDQWANTISEFVSLVQEQLLKMNPGPNGQERNRVQFADPPTIPETVGLSQKPNNLEPIQTPDAASTPDAESQQLNRQRQEALEYWNSSTDVTWGDVAERFRRDRAMAAAVKLEIRDFARKTNQRENMRKGKPGAKLKISKINRKES